MKRYRVWFHRVSHGYVDVVARDGAHAEMGAALADDSEVIWEDEDTEMEVEETRVGALHTGEEVR